MNFFNGDQLTKYEIKQRLNKMNISFDSGIIDKKYYATLYNGAIQNEENRLKIKDELSNDNSFKNICRGQDSKPKSNNNKDNSNSISLKQKFVSTYPEIKEAINEEEIERDSFSSEEKQNSNLSIESNTQTTSSSSSYLSHGIVFGLGLTSVFIYQKVSNTDGKELINILPSFDQIMKMLNNIFTSLKNWTLFLIDIIKPYAQAKYSQFLSYISNLQFDDVTFIVFMSLFVVIILLNLRKVFCKKKENKKAIHVKKSNSNR